MQKSTKKELRVIKEAPAGTGGPMRYVGEETAVPFKKADDLLSIHLEGFSCITSEDVLSDFPCLRFAVLSFCNKADKALFNAIQLAKDLRAHNVCVVSICEDTTTFDEKGNSNELPIEIQLRELKKASNTLIITQKGEHNIEQANQMVFSIHANEDGQANILAKMFENGGYAYYNSYKKAVVKNPEAHIGSLLFDSMFQCPFYLSKKVFCRIEGGEALKLENEDDMGDEGIIKSYLADYLETDQIYCRARKYSEDPALSLEVKILFCGLEEADFAFDENGVAAYRESGDIKLRKRIKRMLSLPFYCKKKDDLYKTSRKVK